MMTHAARALEARDHRTDAEAENVEIETVAANPTNEKPTRVLAFAPNYGANPEADPSPVGFHESTLKRSLTVTAHTGIGEHLDVDVSNYLDDDMTVVEIRGSGFATHGLCDADNNRITFELPSRDTLFAMAQAFTYAADRAEANGMLDRLPDSDRSPYRARRRYSNERLLSALEAIRRVMDAPAPLAVKPWHGADCDECESCTRLRSEPFSCGVCGYHGVPLVHGCNCLDDEKERLPNGLCVPRPETNDPTRFTGAGNDCHHGLVECPRCGGGDDSYCMDLIRPFDRLRALQVVIDQFDSGGPILTQASIFDDDDDNTGDDATAAQPPVMERTTGDEVSDGDTQTVDVERNDAHGRRGVYIARYLSRDGHPIVYSIDSRGRELMRTDIPTEAVRDRLISLLWRSLGELDPVPSAKSHADDEPAPNTVPRFVVGDVEEFHHNGETFRMYLTVPEWPSSTFANSDDARTSADAIRHLSELSAPARAKSAADLVRANGEFMLAMQQIRRGRGAWDWYCWTDADGSPHLGMCTDLDNGIREDCDHSADLHQSFARLQEQYKDRLQDLGIIPYSDGGVFLGDENAREFETRGLFTEIGINASAQAEFNLVLGGCRNAKSGRYEPEINVRVTSDTTLQALIAAFLTGLRDRYTRTPSDR
jgi:hypothetical protein